MPSAGQQPQPAELRRWQPSERQIAYASLLVCLLLLTLLRFAFLRANSATMDELTHVQAGYRYWQCGEFANNPEHPPLVKFVAAFPIRHWEVTGFPAPCGSQAVRSRNTDAIIDYAIAVSSNEPELLWHARLAVMVFPLVLLVAGFFAALRWFGEVAAVLTAILLTFEPTLLAHGSLVTTDMALTAFFFVTIASGIEFVRRPSFLLAAATSVALGLALSSKHSAVLLPAMLLITMLLASRVLRTEKSASIARILVSWLCVCLFAIGILWSFYGFRYAALPNHPTPVYDIAGSFSDAHMVQHGRAETLLVWANRHHLLPEAYIAGIADILTSEKRPAFFFGAMHDAGFWYYFPVALAIKLTLGMMLLFFIALVAPSVRRQHGRTFAVLMVPALLFLGVAMTSKINIGVRHVLPIVPFLVIIAAAGASVLLKRSNAGATLVMVALGAFVLSALHAAPRQISYANEFVGGPNHLYRYLGDSNVDWGQSTDAAEAYIHASGSAPNCVIASGMPFHLPSQCAELPSFFASLLSKELPPVLPDTFQGTFILQPYAAEWSRDYLPFFQQRPERILAGGTVLVYRGQFDLRAIAALRRLERGIFFFRVAHDPERALVEFQAAEPNLVGIEHQMLEEYAAAARSNLPPSAR